MLLFPSSRTSCLRVRLKSTLRLTRSWCQLWHPNSWMSAWERWAKASTGSALAPTFTAHKEPFAVVCNSTFSIYAAWWDLGHAVLAVLQLFSLARTHIFPSGPRCLHFQLNPSWNLCYDPSWQPHVAPGLRGKQYCDVSAGQQGRARCAWATWSSCMLQRSCPSRRRPSVTASTLASVHSCASTGTVLGHGLFTAACESRLVIRCQPMRDILT